MRSVDVAVVGAGPAGSAAAVHLARAGLDVLVLDKATFPRDKCCGDGLTTLALRELEDLGLDPAAVPSWTEVDHAVVRGPGGRSVVLPLPERAEGTFAVVATRLDLDAALVARARAAGAEVAEGHALLDAHDGAEHVDLEVDGMDPVRARWVVGADGMWSRLRKALGADEPGYRGEWHALRQYLHATGPGARRLWVWFEPDLLPGYAWSFPLPGGIVNAGFGILRGAGVEVGDMGERWPELLARPHLRAVLGDVHPAGPVRAWPIPARVDRTVLTRGRALFVGDAATATDVLTGEGIGQALLTGRLAAEAVAHAGDAGPATTRARYEHAVHEHLLADHRLSALLGRALVHPRVADATLRAVDANGWTRRSFGRWLFEDEPRAVLATPGRWHRHLLARPGPYRC